MSDERRKLGALELNPELEHLRVAASDRCWWCGDVATTQEHRFKATTLRRLAKTDDGTINPGNVFKRSSDYDSTLHSLNKGAQIRWPKNLCANCNNSKSQPFDRSYDIFEAFLVEHADVIHTWERLDWQEVYGADWQEKSRNLARYFGKQLGCMLATYQHQIPSQLIDFLEGEDRCPPVLFILYINPRGVDAHIQMREDGLEEGLSSFIGLLSAEGYQTEGVFSGIDYGYNIGYMWVLARWRAGSDVASWFEYQVIELPNAPTEDKN